MIDRIIKLSKNEYLNTILVKVITVFISLAQSVLLARFLGAELKGVHTYIQSITTISSVVVTFGMHQAYPYFRKKLGKEAFYEDYVSFEIGLYAVYMLLALILSLFMPTIELKGAVILTPIIGYANVVSYVCLVESPLKRNKVWFGISVFDVVFLLFLVLFCKRNIFWALVLLGLGDVLRSVIYTYLLHVKPHFRKSQIALAKELFKMGFFPMLALLMTTLNYRIDVFMLRSYDFIAVSQIGIYSIGISVSNKIVLIPDTLKGVMVSKLAKGADEHEVAKVARLSFWVTVLMCIVFLIIGEWFINLLYGIEYLGSYSVMAISAVGALFIGYFKLIAQYNIVNHKQIRNVLLLMISIVTNILLNLYMIPNYGINGAAFATGVGHFICGWVFMIWFAKSNSIRVREMILVQKSDIKLLKSMLLRKGNQ